jgi:hypothetical protein
VHECLQREAADWEMGRLLDAAGRETSLPLVRPRGKPREDDTSRDVTSRKRRPPFWGWLGRQAGLAWLAVRGPAGCALPTETAAGLHTA